MVAKLRFVVGSADHIEVFGGGERLIIIFSAVTACSGAEAPGRFLDSLRQDYFLALLITP